MMAEADGGVRSGAGPEGDEVGAMVIESHLSDHCVVDHRAEGGPQPPATPVWMMRRSLLFLDRTMHFTGVRGTLWRMLGVGRSHKNPNICNV